MIELAEQHIRAPGSISFRERAGENASDVQGLQKVVAGGREESRFAYICRFRGTFGIGQLLVQCRELARALTDALLEKLVRLANLTLPPTQGLDGLDLSGDVSAHEHEAARFHGVRLQLEEASIGEAMMESQRLRWCRRIERGPDVVREHLGERRADLRMILGHMEHLEETPVPGGESRLRVEHPDSLRHVLERRAQLIVIEQDGFRGFREQHLRGANRVSLSPQNRLHHDVRGGRADGAAQQPLRVGGEVAFAVVLGRAGERLLCTLGADEPLGQALQLVEACRMSRNQGVTCIVRVCFADERVGLHPIALVPARDQRHDDQQGNVRKKAQQHERAQRIEREQLGQEVRDSCARVRGHAGQRRHQHVVDPQGEATEQPGDDTMTMRSAPVEADEQRRRELCDGDERDDPDRRERIGVCGGLVKSV